MFNKAQTSRSFSAEGMSNRQASKIGQNAQQMTPRASAKCAVKATSSSIRVAISNGGCTSNGCSNNDSTEAASLLVSADAQY